MRECEIISKFSDSYGSIMIMHYKKTELAIHTDLKERSVTLIFAELLLAAIAANVLKDRLLWNNEVV